MKIEINYIKGKNLITKNLDENRIGGYFEVPDVCMPKLYESLNKVLTLSADYNWTVTEYDCNIDTDCRGYLNYDDWYWIVKLSIVIPDILLIWTIMKAERLTLTI